MRNNSIILGEKRIEGNYNRIIGAGEVQVANSDIGSLYISGEAHISHSAIHKLRGAGEVVGDNVNFGNVKITGEMNLHGVCKADVFTMIGELSADFLECKILRNGTPNMKIKVEDKKPRKIDVLLRTNNRSHCQKKYMNSTRANVQWWGTLKAETFENFYGINLSCDYEFKNIISSALLMYDGEIVCDNFYSFDGGIQGGSINAENITIILNDEIDLQTIVGSNIRICKTFQEDKLFKSIPKSVHYKNFTSDGSMVNIPSIEGDRISIEHTKSALVSGIDVVIGDLCIVDRVEYKDAIRISEKSVVNEVVKL